MGAVGYGGGVTGELRVILKLRWSQVRGRETEREGGLDCIQGGAI